METTAISTEKARSRTHERAFHSTAREDWRGSSWGPRGGVRSGLSFSCIPDFCFIDYRRFRRPAGLPGPHFLLQQSPQNQQRHGPFPERQVVEAGEAEGLASRLPVVVADLAPAAPAQEVHRQLAGGKFGALQFFLRALLLPAGAPLFHHSQEQA